MSNSKSAQVRRAITILLAFVGALLVGFSLAAEVFGLDLTPGFGVVQMFQLLIGISCLTLAAFLYLYGLRPKGTPRSLQADIGIRLAATGLVFAFVSGLSDLIGIGTHVDPNFERPYAGPLQIGGLLLGIGAILAGLLLYYTSRGARRSSSLEFLVNNGKKEAEEEKNRSYEG